jgi:hypothetical protein
VRQFSEAKGKKRSYTRAMGFADALDQMPRSAASAADRFREALAMFEEGVALQRQNLRRRNPAISESQLEEMLQAWLAREDTR